ncbi:uncharacterized protein F5891DRAFT_1196759 [Suillus fuscotomentosus]|uniref:Uncharacterized protein n=1 Tax=Suillus fuscotomentosus TaxID=1912939 RepID=A0AAD4DU08_9AGAM|nr:uncharacterized protein F5891DRAFT_1196759 [Suillus fuscotomentosus]KAG1893134.1 hypothetical protein F5891DRAFT_1196759 [Suillus fuscotomentosus]
MADDEDLAREIFRITLEDKISVENDDYVDSESVALGMSRMRLADEAINDREPSAQHENQAWQDYHTLYLLDHEADHHVRTVTDVINTLDSIGDKQALAMLSEGHTWLEKSLGKVMNMDVGTDTCNEQFRHAQLQLLQDTKEAAKSIMCVIAHRKKQDPNLKNNASEAVETDRVTSNIGYMAPLSFFPFILALVCLRLALLYRLSIDRILGTVPVPRLPPIAPTCARAFGL